MKKLFRINRRNILTSIFLSIAFFSFAVMTDQQVINFIKQQAALGKSEQEIGKALLARGVTPQQAQRIKASFEDKQGAESNVTSMNVSAAYRERTHNSGDEISSGTMDEIGREIDMGNNGTVSSRQIYGHSVFNSRALTFEPSENIATPQNYTLGPGDEVIIDIWGNNEDHIRQTISPEGSIMIDQIGPVYLNGMNINAANNHIKSVFSKKYAGMAEEDTQVQVTLGQVRSIQVDILGEVATPGTFRLSPFSSVFHALYRAGGINDIGSMRNIQVLRNGKKVSGIDIYEYLFEGKTDGNIRLQEGDIIIVPPYDRLVSIDGNVKRPMYYEMQPDETIKDLLNYAGGFTGDAYTDVVRLSRQANGENELYNIESGEFTTYQLQDGDLISVGTILDRFSNRVELKGSVYRPGMYAISPNLTTVGELIARAEGLTDDAYTGRALLFREGPELQLEIEAINIADILSGMAPDIELRRNDVLVISSIHELQTRGNLTIRGQVARPGTYPYAENTTLEDLIFQAGGLLEGASTARVDVARRINDPNSLQQTNDLATIYSVSIDKSLKIGSGQNFILEPFDLVTVRMSPGYETQQSVRIDGEVLFAGNYVLEKRNERISDLVNRAGGVLDAAYIKGAYLERRLTEAEFQARQEVLRIARQNQNSASDSISLSKIEVSNTYNVGINLEKALENPGTHYDLVLQEGDRLFIPQLQSTVKISGDVMFPNAVLYEPGKKLSYYIDQAGGYGQRAKKNKAFIVYMNGTVTKAKRNSPIEPGCQIIVPSKPSTSGTNWAQVMAIASSFTTVAALAATITNIFK